MMLCKLYEPQSSLLERESSMAIASNIPFFTSDCSNIFCSDTNKSHGTEGKFLVFAEKNKSPRLCNKTIVIVIVSPGFPAKFPVAVKHCQVSHYLHHDRRQHCFLATRLLRSVLRLAVLRVVQGSWQRWRSNMAQAMTSAGQSW